jgi:hypothetical protein
VRSFNLINLFGAISSQFEGIISDEMPIEGITYDSTYIEREFPNGVVLKSHKNVSFKRKELLPKPFRIHTHKRDPLS